MKRMTVLMPTLVYSLILYTCYQACGYYQSASPSQGYFTYQSKCFWLNWFVKAGCVDARVFLTVSLCMTNLFCYTRTVLGRQKGSVQYLPHPQSQLVAIQPVDATGQPLTCSHCRKVKTARTHHCRQCNQCQPGMDHHCVW
ncbi:hypothetical protein BY458DRAFT_207716 [Sporodiniella umbellata]|nr:hypothetical protein BY458DRAFT_207716 [Sporodiniella umbellata]